jgi:hypothetical protein
LDAVDFTEAASHYYSRRRAKTLLFPVEKAPSNGDNRANNMAKKSDKQSEVSKDLWIAPRYSLKGPAGERAWENRPGGAPNSSRFLELADIALGVKKPAAKKKRTPGTSAHQTAKTEPYSGMDYNAKDNIRR